MWYDIESSREPRSARREPDDLDEDVTDELEADAADDEIDDDEFDDEDDEFDDDDLIDLDDEYDDADEERDKPHPPHHKFDD